MGRFTGIARTAPHVVPDCKTRWQSRTKQLIVHGSRQLQEHKTVHRSRFKQIEKRRNPVSRPLRSSPQRAQRSLFFLSCLIVRETDTIRHGASHESGGLPIHGKRNKFSRLPIPLISHKDAFPLYLAFLTFGEISISLKTALPSMRAEFKSMTKQTGVKAITYDVLDCTI